MIYVIMADRIYFVTLIFLCSVTDKRRRVYNVTMILEHGVCITAHFFFYCKLDTSWKLLWVSYPDKKVFGTFWLCLPRLKVVNGHTFSTSAWSFALHLFQQSYSYQMPYFLGSCGQLFVLMSTICCSLVNSCSQLFILSPFQWLINAFNEYLPILFQSGLR